MRLERVPTGTGAILYDPTRLAHPDRSDFDPQTRPATRAARGRGSAWFLEPLVAGGPALALRHYRRGGLLARFNRDRYCWTGEDATRCFRELRLLARIEALGLPAARPVAALYQRDGLTYRAALLTVRIEGARPLSGQFDETRLDVWARVGSVIGAFHRAGFCHADLNAHNILVDRAGAVHLIDFDRGEQRAVGRWAQGNLDRLARSLAKVGGPGPQSAAWAALLDGYGTPRSAPSR